jgi:hypothetical protein
VALALGVHEGWVALGFPAPTGRWDAFMTCILTGGVYTVGFAAAMWFLPGLTPSDREQLIRFIPGGHRFIRYD